MECDWVGRLDDRGYHAVSIKRPDHAWRWDSPTQVDDEGYIEGTAIVLRHDESGTELRLVVGGAAYLTGIRKGQPAEIALILDICEKPKEGSVAPM